MRRTNAHEVTIAGVVALVVSGMVTSAGLSLAQVGDQSTGEAPASAPAPVMEQAPTPAAASMPSPVMGAPDMGMPGGGSPMDNRDYSRPPMGGEPGFGGFNGPSIGGMNGEPSNNFSRPPMWEPGNFSAPDHRGSMDTPGWQSGPGDYGRPPMGSGGPMNSDMGRGMGSPMFGPGPMGRNYDHGAAPGKESGLIDPSFRPGDRMGRPFNDGGFMPPAFEDAGRGRMGGNEGRFPGRGPTSIIDPDYRPGEDRKGIVDPSYRPGEGMRNFNAQEGVMGGLRTRGGPDQGMGQGMNQEMMQGNGQGMGNMFGGPGGKGSNRIPGLQMLMDMGSMEDMESVTISAEEEKAIEKAVTKITKGVAKAVKSWAKLAPKLAKMKNQEKARMQAYKFGAKIEGVCQQAEMLGEPITEIEASLDEENAIVSAAAGAIEESMDNCEALLESVAGAAGIEDDEIEE